MENIFSIPKQEHLYIYDRYKKRIPAEQSPLQPLPFYFFGSGSSGNSVYLNRLHTLIDLGFSYKKYSDFNPNFFLDVDYVILTHEHSDHFNFTTFYKILEMAPNVKFIMLDRLYNTITQEDQTKNKLAKYISGNFTEKINNIKNKYHSRLIVINKDQNTMVLTTRHQVEFWFTPHIVSHGDIQNLAIEISTQKFGIHLLYSSDIDHLLDTTGGDQIRHLGLPLSYTTREDLFSSNFIPHKDAIQLQPLNNPFNLMFLEANYDKNILQKALEKDPYNAHARGNLRHISEQEAWEYINLALSSDGLFIPLHASTTFGTLIQDLD